MSGADESEAVKAANSAVCLYGRECESAKVDFGLYVHIDDETALDELNQVVQHTEQQNLHASQQRRQLAMQKQKKKKLKMKPHAPRRMR